MYSLLPSSFVVDDVMIILLYVAHTVFFFESSKQENVMSILVFVGECVSRPPLRWCSSDGEAMQDSDRAHNADDVEAVRVSGGSFLDTSGPKLLIERDAVSTEDRGCLADKEPT